MNHSMLNSERITAMVSTLMAIAILAAGVTAHQSRVPLDELERLESDLQFQLDWAFRHDSKERSQRIARLEETIAAWQLSPRSEEDRKLLASWLLESTIRSMPGTTKPLPSVPEFGKPHKIELPSVAALPKPATTKPDKRKDVQSIPIKRKTAQSTLIASHGTNAIPSTTPTADVAIPVANTKPLAEHVDQLPENLTAKPLSTKPPGSDTPPPPNKPAVTKEKPVEINLTELTARIAGYHEGLDHIETVLLFANSPDLDFLEQQVQELTTLMRDYRFVKLYHEALSVKQRKQVSAPRSMNPTLAEVRRLLKRYENHQDGDFLGSFDPAQHKRVEKLRQKLASISENKD